MYDNHANWGLYFALNVNTTPTSTEIYFESNDATCYMGCERKSRERTRALNSTANISTNITRSPHLSELVGIRFPNQPKFNECNKWKIWETMIYENDETNESEVVTRFYEEFLHFCRLNKYSVFDRETDKESFILEEKVKFLDNGYQINYTFPFTYTLNQRGKLNEKTYYEIFTSVQNDSMALTNIHLNFSEIIVKYPSNPNQIPFAIVYQRTSLVVSLFDTLDRFNAKLENWNGELLYPETIFDAIIYDHGTAKSLDVLIKKLIPRFLKSKSLTRSNEFFRNIVTSGIMNQIIHVIEDGIHVDDERRNYDYDY